MSASQGCTAGWCASEPWCSVACTADVLGRKWHAVIVSLLLAEGPLGFSRIESAVEGLSDTVLSDSLDDLAEKDVVRRRVVSDRPVRVEYSLTDRGEALAPVVEAMREWGRRQQRPDSG